MSKKLRNISFILLALGMSPIAHAQSLGVPAPIQYVVSPDTPGPNTQVTIQAQGVGSFVGNATVIWSENGKVMSQGVGQNTFTFTTGALGTETKIHVEVNSITQGVLTNDWIFTPSLINLVWEADTTVPPFYRGKALYSGGSTIKVVAFPSIVANGKTFAPSSLSFEWTLDSIPQPDESGLGKNSLTFNGSQLQNSEDVSVDVYYAGNKVGIGEIVIPATTPDVVLYDQDPLRGTIFDAALPAAISLGTQELTVQAVPYYFSNSSLANSSLMYDWTLNSNETSGPNSAKGLLTLQETGSGTGSATIGVSLQNNDADKYVQAAQAALQIIFSSQQSGSGLFGL
jgi:hypothetical protein